jgi:hypothetical protein
MSPMSLLLRLLPQEITVLHDMASEYEESIAEVQLQYSLMQRKQIHLVYPS